MISDKSQGSVAARLWYDGLFSYHLTAYLLLSLAVKISKIGESLVKLLTGKKVDCFVCPVLAMILLIGEELAR